MDEHLHKRRKIPTRGKFVDQSQTLRLSPSETPTPPHAFGLEEEELPTQERGNPTPIEKREVSNPRSPEYWISLVHTHSEMEQILIDHINIKNFDSVFNSEFLNAFNPILFFGKLTRDVGSWEMGTPNGKGWNAESSEHYSRIYTAHMEREKSQERAAVKCHGRILVYDDKTNREKRPRSYAGLHEILHALFDIFCCRCEARRVVGEGFTGHGETWAKVALAIERLAEVLLVMDIDLHLGISLAEEPCAEFVERCQELELDGMKVWGDVFVLKKSRLRRRRCGN